MKKAHVVKNVLPGSIAEELEIGVGDKILAIDNTEIVKFDGVDYNSIDKVLKLTKNSLVYVTNIPS